MILTERAFVRGWVIALVFAGFASLVQFLPGVWYTSTHATILIWCVVVLSMFLYTIFGE